MRNYTKTRMYPMHDQIIRKSVSASLLAIALPSILEQLLTTIMQYVDTAMLGNYGTSAAAAAGLSTTLMWLIGAPISAAGVAFLVIISSSIGSGDSIKAERALSQAHLIIVMIGVIEGAIALLCAPVMPILMNASREIRYDGAWYFALISFPMIFRAATVIYSMVMRAFGDAKTPMFVNLAANLLNVFLNIFFIYPATDIKIFSFTVRFYGVGLGAVGAGVATAISTIISGTWLFILIARRYKSVFSLKLDKAILTECSHLALPLGLTRVISCFGYVTFAGTVSGMGTEIFAAHSFATTAETLFYIPGYGMQSATSTLVGYARGKGDYKLYKKVLSLSLYIITAIMLVSGLLLFALAEPVLSIFTSDREVIRLGGAVLRIVALTEPIFGLSVVIQGALSGLGKTRCQFIIESLSMWAIRILPTIICVNVFNLGLRAVWYCMISDNICKFICFFIIIMKIKHHDKCFLNEKPA